MGIKTYQYEQYLEKRMHNKRSETLQKISSVVTHPKIAEHFAEILAWAIRENDKDAQKIAELLGLDEEHFISIADDYDALVELINDENIANAGYEYESRMNCVGYFD